MIEVSSLHKSFKLSKKRKKEDEKKVAKDPREEGMQFHTLKDLSFHFPKGKIIGLLGSNGAGKTTLLRILSTTLQASSGNVAIDGLPIQDDTLAIRNKIGFLAGNSELYGRLTPREILRFFGKFYGLAGAELDERIQSLFDELDIHHYADRRCDYLSSGMKQKVSIARSLVHSPDLIILDEPTTGLDVAASQSILNYIEKQRNAGVTIIFSTHHMHEVARLCDWVMVMALGQKRFEGTVEQMLSDSACANLDDAYLHFVNKDRAAIA